MTIPIIKYYNTKDKENPLRVSERKGNRKRWGNTSENLTRKTFQPNLLYLAQLSIRYEV